MDGLSLFKILYNYKDFLLKARINYCEYNNEIFVLSIFNRAHKNLVVNLNNKFPLQFSDEKISLSNKIPYLSNSLIEDIKQKGFDRAFYIMIAKRKPSGKLIKYKIIFELVGKLSNVIIVDETEKIIFCWNNNNIDMDRELKTGKYYVPFKSNKRYNLLSSQNCKFEEFEGFYNVTSKHAYKILEQNNYDCEKTKEMILNSLKTDTFYIDLNKKIIPFHIPDFLDKINIDQLNSLNSKTEKNENQSIKINRLKKYFSKLIDKNIKLLEKLKEELSEAKNFIKYQEEAELLKNNLHIIKNNRGLVTLNKYTENGIEQVSYYLDENENIPEKINKLFEKSEKLKRSIPKLENRIQEIKNMILYYQDTLYSIEYLDKNEIEELYQQIYTKSKNKISKKSTPSYLLFQLDDTQYYVGRNSKSNQYIITKIANPEDYWFHAHEIPSAHLIAKKNGELTENEIITAARIVAHFSKYKDENKVPVDYTKRKYVKKPKNTPEGFVIYNNYKTITVSPFTEKELEKLKTKNETL
ncbi:fibronectin/fibrinogen-binding protein [Deferribacter desulfuricans SSM1]|uniref:Fibronectin/fibrinogen-binding protein n=1 Tax=Deferribacter desulfuricans (strain DSM 14783 / JCM 11476 / NBRC 101012 / SSM1) TaxID=639282 RepID=D3PBY2_DEFDS|nr:NFACT RNA binding domain-containing protein [Deferribacter desulfuricans]BAI80105.1 fibronectin/fibrinogen-binding protein [Deferribacter desulfuricans SSM1]